MRPRQFSDDQLVETARRCFLEHGPSVSMAVIAAELGVSQAALFKRIGTKDALFRLAFADAVSPAWMALADAGPDDRPVPQQLLELAREIDRFFAQLFPIMAVIHENRTCPQELFARLDEPPPIRSHRTLAAWLRRLHESGRARVATPEATALMFLGSLQARHALRHFLGDRAPSGGPDYLHTLVSTIWASIRPHA